VGVDDEIRDKLRAVAKEAEAADAPGLREKVEALLGSIQEMVFKEENIMLPMLLENLTQDEWKRVADEAQEFGFCLIDPPPAWNPAPGAAPPKQAATPGMVTLPTGVLSVRSSNVSWTRCPSTSRLWARMTRCATSPRTRSASSRAPRPSSAARCPTATRPPSVHIVEQLVEDLRSGKKDHEDFWIEMGGKYVLIRYFAVRSGSGSTWAYWK
jgi:DUF438 domain-containing protein